MRMSARERRSYVVSAAQQQALEELAALLGDFGYLRCAMAAWSQLHSTDFIALRVRPDESARFMVISAVPSGFILIRPSFSLACDNGKIRAAIADKCRWSCRIEWRNQKLRECRDKTLWWARYLPCEVVAERWPYLLDDLLTEGRAT